MTTTTTWRETFSAHDYCWDDESIDITEVRGEVREMIAEVKQAALDLPNGIEWWNLEHGDLNELAHILANLNNAYLHLTDVTGC